MPDDGTKTRPEMNENTDGQTYFSAQPDLKRESDSSSQPDYSLFIRKDSKSEIEEYEEMLERRKRRGCLNGILLCLFLILTVIIMRIIVLYMDYREIIRWTYDKLYGK